MKAIVLTGYGDLDKLELRDVDEPHVGRGEIKVRVSAASINPVDWKMRSGEPKGAEGRDLVVRAMMTHPDPVRLAQLGHAVAQGRVTLPIARRLALSQGREAQKLAEHGASGKVLLVM
jgi:NADPH:quinone reductase-like Zn-dependent oxidoreductase